MLRGIQKLGFKFALTMAGYNLIRLPKLLQAMHERQQARTSETSVHDARQNRHDDFEGPDTVRKLEISAAC